MAQTGKKKRGRPRKPPIEMTSDELMARMFNKPVQKKLKKLAESKRPKAEKSE